MVDSIATTSLIGYRPVIRGSFSKDASYKRRTNNFCRILLTDFVGCRSICTSTSLNRPRTRKWGIDQYGSSIKALAVELTKEAYAFREENRTPKNMNFPVELTKEAYAFREENRTPKNMNFPVDTDTHRQTDYWPPPNKADDPSIHNPLLRQERMGCGWLGLIFEWEGVIIEDNPELESQAWLTLAQEEGISSPPGFILKRIEGMKNEHALSEVLCWSRDPTQLRRMAIRKEEIYQRLQGGIYRLRTGSREFLDFLMDYKIPMALVSTRPRKTLEAAVRVIEMEGSFNVIVAAEDVYRGKPDPEMFVYAAQLLKFIPERCIVFGNSNSTVEAAHDARMKCVAVASKHPVYELRAAELVVRHLDELTVVDLKNLVATELPEFGSDEPELEMEEEIDEPHRSTSVGVDDSFW